MWFFQRAVTSKFTTRVISCNNEKSRRFRHVSFGITCESNPLQTENFLQLKAKIWHIDDLNKVAAFYQTGWASGSHAHKKYANVFFLPTIFFFSDLRPGQNKLCKQIHDSSNDADLGEDPPFREGGGLECYGTTYLAFDPNCSKTWFPIGNSYQVKKTQNFWKAENRQKFNGRFTASQ